MKELATQILVLRVIEIGGIIVVAVVLLVKWLSVRRLRKATE